MAEKRKIKLPVEKLLVGFMVDLELSWTKHPFLFSKFKISSKSDILVIKQLGLREVTVFPDQSDIEVAQKSQKEATPSKENSKQLTDEKWQEKNSKLENADKYRKQRSGVAKKYKEQAAKVRKLTAELKTEPANAIRDAAGLVDGLASDFENQKEIMTNLVNLGTGHHTMYNHCINVTILSLSLAATRGIEGDKLRQLARGALLHDVGKVELPGPIVNKTSQLTPAEVGVYQQHAPLGRKLCELVEGMPQDVLKIIELHHEFVDGSGFPHKIKGEEIPELVKIVSVANTYDNLCNPRDPNKAMTPKIALATMYSRFKDKLDNKLVQSFISTLGVFPPGSVVSLNDESIGLVVSVDPSDMLNPQVLLYNPDIPPLQALIINLNEHADLKIAKVLKPGEYPKRVYEYLGIEDRIGFMTSQK
ncbi:HD-GYP domain-containing protein [Aliikangiella sp. IMCC44359]|uniref:HD-GYP domain-containing protein n=1 Tax=Aliikangiella sp. IMCC44359 TaxID=3459125 RepID=UPI00403B0246